MFVSYIGMYIFRSLRKTEVKKIGAKDRLSALKKSSTAIWILRFNELPIQSYLNERILHPRAPQAVQWVETENVTLQIKKCINLAVPLGLA